MRVGVDTGGTFTDAVDERGEIEKVPSTRGRPDDAVRDALDRLGRAPSMLAHGTTVATNALLERRGARVALVGTEGFTDIIEIARQARPSLYDIFADRPPALVERGDRFGVDERVTHDGEILRPIDISTVPDVSVLLAAGIEAVAVGFLHADRYPEHEQLAAAALRAGGLDVTCSHEVVPEFREYERIVTTAVNAYLRPVCRDYVMRLADLATSVLVMTSAGGLVPLDAAAEVPASLLLSGPAGGARAAAGVAAACGFSDAVAFDMGGTSTDVCLVRGGVPEPAPQRRIAGLPVRLPSLDIHTIGAGGGSIARIDAGGALVVGPPSAGAEPGPVAYGRGGTQPTVTDADLVLGRIPQDSFGALGRLDTSAARAALDRAGTPAEGVVSVVDESMRQAVRAVTVERGVDPRGLALVAFGGAGPLHACDVAEGLDMSAVIVPPRAGVFSAVGILGAPQRRELVASYDGGALAPMLATLSGRAMALVGDRARVETAVDVRYRGQSHEITVADVDSFAAEHERLNGYRRDEAEIEIVAVRARATGDAPDDLHHLVAPAREHLEGPTIAAEPDCTVWVPPGWTGEVSHLGAWVLRRQR